MPRTLREAADERGVQVGAAVAAGPLRGEYGYRNALREFNAVTTENALKMERTRPSEHEFDFENADLIVDFALSHDMYMRGHTLVWHNQLPEWLHPWQYTDRELRQLLRQHVRTVAGRYAGMIDAWDVVNEAVDDSGGLRETPWLRGLGEEYLDLTFEWANDVAPDADLYYNDYGADEINDKSDEIYDLVSGMVDRGIPIDGVGLQMHAMHSPPDPDSIADNVERFRDLGLKVDITEMDVPFPVDSVPENYLEEQADYYGDVVEAVLDAGCETFVVWGVDDGHSWISHFDDALTDDPLLLDSRYGRKPAYDAVVEALS